MMIADADFNVVYANQSVINMFLRQKAIFAATCRSFLPATCWAAISTSSIAIPAISAA
jgi:hypothetical protein